jgi:hypothetical protein
MKMLIGGGLPMLRRGKIKPSKPQLLFGMIVGIIFFLIGIGVLITIPHASLPGAILTLFALVITGMNAYHFFSRKGTSLYEVDLETENDPRKNEDDFERKLRKIDRLYKDGIITEEEFRRKREEMLREKW